MPRNRENQGAPGVLFEVVVRPFLFVLWSFVLWGTLIWCASLWRAVEGGTRNALEALVPRGPGDVFGFLNLGSAVLALVGWVFAVWTWADRRGHRS
jgi:hypothetical protein